MNILLTGATGFIGSHLLPRLLEDKHNVTILLREHSDTWRIKEYLSQCQQLVYTTSESLEKACPHNIDMIIHLAAYYVNQHQSTKEIQEMYESNVVFPTLLLELAVKHNISHFINTGTCFEYQRTKNDISEEGTIDPYNLYALTKVNYEQVLQYYTNHDALRAITLKLFYPFGEKDNDKIITLIMKSLTQDKELFISSGTQELNFTYVRDIVEAYIRAMHFLPSQSTPYEVFNIGSDNTYTIRNLISLSEKLHNKKSHIHLGAKPMRKHEIMYMKANNSKAKQLLHWKPNHSIEAALHTMYSYYLQHSK